MKSPWIRVILFIAVYICVVVLPWWLSVLILCGLTIYLPKYLEVLFFGFLFDTLYDGRYSFPYFGLTVAFVFLILVLFIKPKIRV